jgi:hypothetical protein
MADGLQVLKDLSFAVRELARHTTPVVPVLAALDQVDAAIAEEEGKRPGPATEPAGEPEAAGEQGEEPGEPAAE